MSDWREREVGNEIRSREINEWLHDANEGPDLGTKNPYVCECSDEDCKSTMALTHLEYEEVRAHATYFAIAPDHESSELDVMASERSGFAIIRKFPGFPASLAAAADPRSPRAVG